jgi:hypothetical protein
VTEAVSDLVDVAYCCSMRWLASLREDDSETAQAMPEEMASAVEAFELIVLRL